MIGASRRALLGTSAAAGMVGVAAPAVASVDFPFWNNVPDPLLSDKDLPTFKFELGKSAGKVDGGSFAKEANVEQLAISKGIAGVSMQLAPGVARELHWHATAAEWGYVLTGSCRTTMIDPQGHSETNDFEPGDVWYFPRGHGHSIQCLGGQPVQFILVFDNGYFSEFGTFSITDWIGHTPKELLAKNLGLPASAFDSFPKSEVYFTKGKVPPATPAMPHQGALSSVPNTHKYRLLAQAPNEIHRGGRFWMADAQRFPISTTITGVVMELEPGALRELHWHPNADEWQYVISGQLSVTLFGSGGRYRIETLNEGDVAYIPQGYGHSIENVGSATAQFLLTFNSGNYQAIDLSDWLASNPDYLLADHFNQPESVISEFPKSTQFITPV